MKAKTVRAVLLVLCAGVLNTSASLVGYWTFDESNGTSIADSSGLANHGTLFNGKPGTWTTGVGGGALYFDGTTGLGSTYVSIADSASLDLTNALSFATWVRCDDTSRDAPILVKEGEGQLAYWFGAFGPSHFGVLLDTDGNPPWSILDRDQGNILQGVWVHLASTWDGTTIRHFINGVQLAETASFAGPLNNSSSPAIIGANVPYNNTAFKGAVDDLRLYNHALNLDEIRTLAGFTTGLVGHWTFDEGGGTNILDRSPQANHGTLINGRSNTWTSGVRGGALYFPGTVGSNATYVSIPDKQSLRIVGDISCAAWVRCDDIHRDAPIIAKEGEGHLSYWFGAFGLSNEGGDPGNFGMLLDADGNQPWTMYDRNQGAIPEGQWVHLASVRNGNTIRHYLNGEPLGATGGTFNGPIFVSDAFLAIGVNSLYTFAPNHTAFLGAVDEVVLHNYALSAEEIRGLYLSTGNAFRITAVNREGNDLRVTWASAPGRSYTVQTNGQLNSAGFVDLTPPIAVPADFMDSTTNYVHTGAFTNPAPLFYRIRLLP